MKIATWDSGLRWDDPNLRWGSPSYLLEPGDPGYVDPFPSVSKPQKKHKMKHNSYYPIKQADQVPWLVNFMNKLSGHTTALGLTPAQATTITADCGWLVYVLQTWLPAVRAWSQSCTNAVNLAQTGIGPVQVLPAFTAPVLPTSTAPTTLGALTRLFAFVQNIKNGGKLTDDIASDLQIVGSAATGPDLSAVQPILTATISGGRVEIGWGWQGNVAWLDMCELQVDRGDGKGFVPLTFDTTPDYNDTQPFPATKTVWTYRAIYRVNDQQVGLWSAPVSISVG